ncbi:MAG: archease [Planctomycetota bacterium]|nr:MAG: archease [Planctomycetota bacterium]
MATHATPRWETFSHGADIGVRGFGPTREQAFEAAALALTGVITDPAQVRPSQRVEIACAGADEELLLYAWLNALITQMALRGMLFSRFEVSIAADALTGAAWGEPIDVARHRPAVEAKGATFTELRVRPGADGEWVAQCVIDV